MCYRIGRDGRLYIAENAAPTGGIMAAEFRDPCPKNSMSALCDSLIRECSRRSFSGIYLDIPAEQTGFITEEAAFIAARISKANLRIYIPHHLPIKNAGVKAVIGTAVSGGTYEGYLSSAIKRYGAENLALEADLIMSDFTLPDRSGRGKTLTKDEFRKLYSIWGKNSFFSKELKAYYFNYVSNEKTHFVLYETSQSIKAKLSAANKMGINTAFLYYPDFVGTIF